MTILCTIRYIDVMSDMPSAGALLRTARERAGLSQAELAARAGVTQSVISVYESGHRQPALSTLAALVEASGSRLDIRVRRSASPLSGLVGPFGRRLRRNRVAVLRAAAAHGVTVRGVFGSVARGEDRPDSDVDLLVALRPGVGLFELGRLAAELEELLGTRVDLVPAADLKPGVRRNVFAELVAL